MATCALCGGGIAAGIAWRCPADTFRAVLGRLLAPAGLMPVSLIPAATNSAALALRVDAGFDRSWLLCPHCGAAAAALLGDGPVGRAPGVDTPRHATEPAQALAPGTDDEQWIRYRPGGEASAGIPILARGLRNLIAAGALAGQQWEVECAPGGGWTRLLLADSSVPARDTVAEPPRPGAHVRKRGGSCRDRPAENDRGSLAVRREHALVAPEVVGPPAALPAAGVATHPQPARGASVAWPEDETFRELMAQQLRRSPWFGASAAFHVALVALLWWFLPVRSRPPARVQVRVVEAAHRESNQPVQVDPPAVVAEEPAEDNALPEDLVLETVHEDEVFLEPIAQPLLENVDGWAADIRGDGAEDFGKADRLYGARRSTAAKVGGGGGEDAAVNAGLKWLANHQDRDGRWDCDGFMKHDALAEGGDGAGAPGNDVGITGLALLAFLGNGSTARDGPYRDVIKKGVAWLRQQQDRTSGLFGAGNGTHYIYDHAIATYAVCEAYGLSQYSLLRPVAQQALDYLESHRNPGSVWRYGPRDGDNDLSVTGWCIMACESGRHFGLGVSDAAIAAARAWLDHSEVGDGNYGYAGPGYRMHRSEQHDLLYPPDRRAPMAAVGLFCRFFMGDSPRRLPSMRATSDLLLDRPPLWHEAGGTIDVYYWYYATYALFQMGGAHWTQWRAKLRRAVVASQRQDRQRPDLYGSWDPDHDCWGDIGGRVYTTSMLTLTLEAYYRYSRLIR